MSADTVDMAAGDVADRVMALVRNMREELVVLQGTRDDARAKASAAGLDEESLWNEWFNENIHDADLYAVSVKDPDAGYLGWLARRIAEPFRWSVSGPTTACGWRWSSGPRKSPGRTACAGPRT